MDQVTDSGILKMKKLRKYILVRTHDQLKHGILSLSTLKGLYWYSLVYTGTSFLMSELHFKKRPRVRLATTLGLALRFDGSFQLQEGKYHWIHLRVSLMLYV